MTNPGVTRKSARRRGHAWAICALRVDTGWLGSVTDDSLQVGMPPSGRTRVGVADACLFIIDARKLDHADHQVFADIFAPLVQAG